MLLEVTGEHKYVVNIDRHEIWSSFGVQRCHYLLHQALEYCWCVSQPEGHNLELKEPLWGRKGSLLSRAWMDTDLPESGGQVDGREVG